MKIVYTIGTLMVGGAEVFLVNLISNLNLSKYDVTVIVLDKENHTYLEERLHTLNVKVYFLEKKPGFSIRTFLKMTKLLKEIKPDIIHGNIGGMIYSLPYIFLYKVKAIHTMHTNPQIEYGKLKRKILKFFYKREKIIPVVISKENLNIFLDIYKLKKVYLIHNGIELKKFLKKHQFANEIIRIGHVGRFEEVKNHKVIFQVYEKLKAKGYKVSLKLIGNGSLFAYYQKLYPEVTFIQNSNEVEKELESIDFFLFPSLYEGFPLAIIEAMASGLVIIASNISGIKELIIDGKNGFKIDVNDVDGYVEKIEKIFLDSKLKLSISTNNNYSAKRYSIEEMVRKYEKLYKE